MCFRCALSDFAHEVDATFEIITPDFTWLARFGKRVIAYELYRYVRLKPGHPIIKAQLPSSQPALGIGAWVLYRTVEKSVLYSLRPAIAKDDEAAVSHPPCFDDRRVSFKRNDNAP